MRAAENDYLIENLHCFVQGMPADVTSELAVVNERSIAVLKMPSGFRVAPLSVSFEEVMERLGQVASCHTEPDGWFLWTGTFDERFWSLNGQLTDDGQHLLFCELKGDCPSSTLRALSAMMAHGDQRLMFQLPAVGMFLGEPSFHEYVQSEPTL